MVERTCGRTLNEDLSTSGEGYSPQTGRVYLGTRPSRKKIQKLCESISEQTRRNRTLQDVTEIVDRLNRQR